MSSRISTSGLYLQSLSTLLAKQASLAHTQRQLATGQRLVSAKDDPVAAGTAVGLDRALAELERYGANANLVGNRLNLQENALTHAGDLLARARDLAVQANNATVSSDDRAAIASELVALREQLIDVANSSDGAGRYLFGGTDDGHAPFAVVAGSVGYAGDQTQRQVEIAPDQRVADTLPGSEVFMRVRTGDGRLDARADAGNAGTGLIKDFSLAGSWSGESYRVEFTAADAYQVLDAGGAVVASGAYASGEGIAFGGLALRIDGAPAAGDGFEIGPADNQDVFTTMQNLIDALGMDDSTPAARAAQQNALQGALRDIGGAQEHLIDARASGGAQLAAIDNAADLREAQSVTLETTLSQIRDLDYAEAISRFSLESTALEAAQTTFMRLQSSSLFDLLRR